MRVSHFRFPALALISGIALSGCAYDMYGDPYGYGYGPRSSVAIGVGYGSPYGGYGYGYPYSGYYGGYGYGYDPFGWYGDYYYPGTGIYVYDRSRTRHVWSGDQQRYWSQRREHWQHHSGATSTGENWSGWRSHHGSNTTTTSAGSTSTTSGWHHHRHDN